MASKTPSKVGTGGEAAAPAPKTTGGGFAKFCCNKEAGTCMGRTGKSWCKLLIFYIIFYISLFSFFFLLLCAVMYSFAAIDVPQKEELNSMFHLVGGSPGLGFRPANKLRDSALIWFKKGDPNNYNKYTWQLGNITRKANNETLVEACSSTTPNLKLKSKDAKMCNAFDAGPSWGPCVETGDFGFAEGKPCVLIRLNRMINWTPERISATTFNNYNESVQNAPPESNGTMTVCISCKGKTSHDQEMIGRINYYPTARPGGFVGPCIPPYYYPYLNQGKYVSPIVFVHFAELPPNVHVQVHCEAHYDNIGVLKSRDFPGGGSTNFELLVDE